MVRMAVPERQKPRRKVRQEGRRALGRVTCFVREASLCGFWLQCRPEFLCPECLFSCRVMAVESKVQQVLCLLEEAGHLDLVRPGAAAAAWPARKAASGVAFSPPRRVTGARKVTLLGKGKARSFRGRARGWRQGVAGTPRLPWQASITQLEVWQGRSRPLRKEQGVLGQGNGQSSSGEDSPMEGRGREGAEWGGASFVQGFFRGDGFTGQQPRRAHVRF
ncbi:hypothetical protein NDU88_001137 [Pleurodeles waltl]|uniref:Uncharacterized protein n=1 Tax=Pleurodeles waltl TaxID=8319 RepID=A0AAV7UW16_PLEWA|nr:hypothetical protein NDU88_001137 [Pleurodeles waltl]